MFLALTNVQLCAEQLPALLMMQRAAFCGTDRF
jgi:hypothetical protein